MSNAVKSSEFSLQIHIIFSNFMIFALQSLLMVIFNSGRLII